MFFSEFRIDDVSSALLVISRNAVVSNSSRKMILHAIAIFGTVVAKYISNAF